MSQDVGQVTISLLKGEYTALRKRAEHAEKENELMRYYLKIYIHAHQSGNSVPPHLEEDAISVVVKPSRRPPATTVPSSGVPRQDKARK